MFYFNLLGRQLTITIPISRWADQCNGDYDKNRLVPAFPNVGQNVGTATNKLNTDDKELATKIQEWYNEV